MRFRVPAAVLCASLFAAGTVVAAPASTPTAPPAPTTPASSDSDAAAKHAKLTDCLREAKSRKLVGAEKSAFIKECTAKP